MQKVTNLLVAVIATLFIGRANAQSPSVEILKTDPVYGGFAIKYQIKQVQALSVLTLEFSGLPTFPTIFKMKSVNWNSDTVFTDTITTSNNTKMPAPPSSFWGRYRLQDTLGTDTVSNVIKITTLPIPIKPSIDTTQKTQNILDTAWTFGVYTSNVKTSLLCFGSFNPNNVIDPSNQIDSIMLDSGTNMGFTHKIPGMVSGVNFYVAYVLVNTVGSDTIGVMKVAPYVTKQRPAGAITGISCTNKQITVSVKVVGYDLKTIGQIWYGGNSSTMSDTLTRIQFTGNGVEYGSFTTPTLKADSTYYFRVRLTNTKGYLDLMTVSCHVGSDPSVFTLTTDSGWSANVDPINGLMEVKGFGGYQLATLSKNASLWMLLSEDTAFQTSTNSSSWTTGGTAGSTPTFTFANIAWSKTKKYYVKLAGIDDQNTPATSINWKPVFMTPTRTFSLIVTKVTVNKSGHSADVTCKYVNTEKVTSENSATFDTDSNFTNPQTTSAKLCTGDSGTVTFTLPSLKDVYYWVKVSGSNMIGDQTTSNKMKFKLDLSAFSYTIRNIVMDNVGKKATIYIHYQNTEGTTSTVYVRLDKNSNFTSPMVSDTIGCVNDSGSAWFTVSNLDTDRYYVVATGNNSDGAQTTSTTAYFQLNTKPYVGIETIGNDIMLSVYPNPTSEQVTIDFNDSYSAPFVLIDLNGQIVLNKKIVAGERIDVSAFPRGMYLYRVGEKSGTLLLQ